MPQMCRACSAIPYTVTLLWVYRKHQQLTRQRSCNKVVVVIWVKCGLLLFVLPLSFSLIRALLWLPRRFCNISKKKKCDHNKNLCYLLKQVYLPTKFIINIRCALLLLNPNNLPLHSLFLSVCFPC